MSLFASYPDQRRIEVFDIFTFIFIWHRDTVKLKDTYLPEFHENVAELNNIEITVFSRDMGHIINSIIHIINIL